VRPKSHDFGYHTPLPQSEYDESFGLAPSFCISHSAFFILDAIGGKQTSPEGTVCKMKNGLLPPQGTVFLIPSAQQNSTSTPAIFGLFFNAPHALGQREKIPFP
jgi:hypothetical protein